MRKKLNLIKNALLLIACTFLLTGCASMSYIGDDYNPQSAGNVQTSAGFYFATYKKSSSLDNIKMSVGITKSTIPNVYIVYIEVENPNNENYIVYQRNFSYSSNEGKVSIFSASEYINAFQSQETGTYAGMQAMAPTISNIATIQNNFQPIGQDSITYQQNTRDNLSGQIGGISSDIASHALNSAASVEAKSKKYFYNFIGVNDASTIKLTYKDLEYSFGTNSKNNFGTKE